MRVDDGCKGEHEVGLALAGGVIQSSEWVELVSCQSDGPSSSLDRRQNEREMREGSNEMKSHSADSVRQLLVGLLLLLLHGLLCTTECC